MCAVRNFWFVLFHRSNICVAAFLRSSSSFFFFNDTATTEIYTLSLHDALPISDQHRRPSAQHPGLHGLWIPLHGELFAGAPFPQDGSRHTAQQFEQPDQPGRLVHRSEEHTSELQSRSDLVCRLLLEKKKNKKQMQRYHEYCNREDLKRDGEKFCVQGKEASLTSTTSPLRVNCYVNNETAQGLSQVA